LFQLKTNRFFLQRSLATAEYDVFKDDDDNCSLFGETQAVTQSTALPVTFSKRAKKILPNVPSDQLQITSNILVKKTIEFHRMNPPALGSVTRNIMYAILYIALNQNEDAIQLSDFIRYIRERHISYFQVKHFFPDHLQVQCDDIDNLFKRSERNVPSSYELRRQISIICRSLRIKTMPLPNMKGLVKRYLEELCLPTQLYTMIERLLELCPPQMKYSSHHKFGILSPNFDARACAYILFVLKLLFGLDDSREHQISDSCAKVNQQTDSKTKLFVWSEWVEYIELRNIILARCHYPSNVIYGFDSEPGSARLFLDFYENLVDKHQVQTKPPTRGKKKMENLRYVFGKLWETHTEEQPASNDPVPMQFEHSLTPARTYFEEILRNQPGSNLFIPPSMHIDHTKRDINRLLLPQAFQNECRQQNIQLNIQPAQNNTNIEFERSFDPVLATSCRDNATHFYQYDTDIDEDDWMEEIDVRRVQKVMDRQRENRMILKDILMRGTLEQEQMEEFGNRTMKFYGEKIQEKFGELIDYRKIMLKFQFSISCRHPPQKQTNPS
jgi:TATA box-binding protein-associated factor RNA polymerase I subunit B